MKKLLLTSFAIVACMFTATAVVVIEPDQGTSTNALTKAIDDNPTESVFELKRNGVYVVDKEYTFKRALELRAQTGTGTMPLVIVVTDALGAKPSQVFKVEKNLTIKGIFFGGDTRGGGIVSHMFRATLGNLIISFDGCYFDRIEQTVMRLDVAGCSVTMNNCIARNIAQTANIDNGRIVDGRSQPQNEVIIKNSTFYNNVGQVYRYGSSSAILNKLEIDQCTFYSSAYRMSFDFALNGKYTNNVMTNCHWKASFSADGGVTPPVAGSVISIDSLKTAADATRVFTVSNNNIYDTQELTDAYSLYPTKVLKRVLVDPLSPWLAANSLTMANNIAEQLTYKNPSPMPMDFIKAFFESTGTNSFNTTANKPFYVEEVAGVDPPEVANPFDFSYGNNKQSAKASTTGGPLGDPRWAPFVTGLANPNVVARVTVFPNPVTNFLNIRFSNSGSAKINIYDMEGRTVHYNSAYQTVGSGQAVRIDMKNLPAGTYLYSVETIENGQLKRANGKVIK